MENRSILIVGKERGLFEELESILAPRRNFKGDHNYTNIKYVLDFEVQGDAALGKVVQALKTGRPFAVIFVDPGQPPQWKGLATIKKIWERAPYTEIIICSDHSAAELENIVAQLGVSDRFMFLTTPFNSTKVKQMAFALTTKWNLILFNRLYVENLELLVQEKTKEIEDEKVRSIQSAKFAALAEMAAGIAHEINNPLAIIQSNVSFMKEMLEQGFDKARFIKIADKIEATTVRVAKIINSLRKFARSSEKDPLENINVEQIILDTLGICTEKFKVHNIDLKFEKLSTKLTIECRQTQLIQVFLNLLNNSYDAIRNQPDKWVKIEIKELTEAVEIWFTDSGKGMSDQIQKRLFSPFFTTKEVGKGTGLGLSLSKGIINEFKGTLYVDKNCPNTRFIVQLPLTKAA